MSKRTKEQQIAHNKRRREIKQEGREGIFAVKYLQAMHPKIYQEINDFYRQLRARYPRRLTHISTKEFKALGKTESAKKHTMLKPQLTICLMSTPDNKVTITEEPPIAMEDLQAEETEKLIQELREDPDLAHVFADITLETTVETERCLPILTPDQEIDNIVNQLYDDAAFMDEFTRLGEDLPELDDNDDIFW